MNMLPFRDYHILQLFKSVDDDERCPLDLSIHRYFKTHKALGSKDRAEIAETVYGIIRWIDLLDHLTEDSITWESRLELYRTFDPKAYQHDPTIAPHIRLSFPENLYSQIVKSHGKEETQKICWECNFPAPTTVRVNTLKTSRKKMLELWNHDFDISPCKHNDIGIRFHKKVNFFQLPAFKEGKFEVQDEGSQLLADLVKCQPGQHVLDYCAGSGGKTLAFAPRMRGKGQIFLYDIRPHILIEARKRLKRAGIQNSQIVLPDDKKLSSLKKKMDWVLVDAPCSGTGTLRRNPDMKWKFDEEMLTRLTGQQRIIFEKALSYVKPGGYIIYSTCSILNEENQDQIEHFTNTYPIELQGSPFYSIPKQGEMDGFFGAVFVRKN